MQVDGICSGGVATIEVYEIKNQSCCYGTVVVGVWNVQG